MARRVRAWDLAASGDTTADFTAGLKMSAADGRYTIEDLVHGRWTPHDRDVIVRQTAEIDGRAVAIVIEQEPGAAGLSQIAAMVRLLAGFTVTGRRPTGDKLVRAGPVASQMEAGNVQLVAGAWNAALIDELCVAEGTLIAAARGNVPIEDIRRGELVLTRSGWNRVLKAELTERKADVIMVKAGNQKLAVTPHHPVWVCRRGFVPAALLHPGDPLLCLDRSESPSERPSFTRERRSTVTPTRRGLTRETISAVDGTVRRHICTVSSMSRKWARSLMECTSITATVIPLTTRSRICSSWEEESTFDGTTKSEDRPSTAVRILAAVASSCPNVLALPSTAASAAGTPFGSTRERRERPSARNAAGRLSPSSPTNNSAVGIALCSSTGRTIGDRIRFASSAREPSLRFEPIPLPARVVAVSSLDTATGKRSVYNLEVEGASEYFANRLLVHNCSFPTDGVHDDIVDACSLAFNFLTEQLPSVAGIVSTRIVHGGWGGRKRGVF